MKKIQSFLSKKITRAMFQYEMIKPGDRVLTAVSGGKDSMILSRHLFRMMKSFPVPFQADFLHIRTEFSNRTEENRLEAQFREWDIPLILMDIRMEDHLAPGKEMNCFRCASVRRKILLKYAAEKGYQSLALGHHMDDILESLLMNMVYNKEISVMVPCLAYPGGPLRLIRPLALLAESHLQEAARRLGLPERSCRCPYEKASRRKHVRKALDMLTENKASLKNNMYLSLTRLKTEYLP